MLRGHRIVRIDRDTSDLAGWVEGWYSAADFTKSEIDLKWEVEQAVASA